MDSFCRCTEREHGWVCFGRITHGQRDGRETPRNETVREQRHGKSTTSCIFMIKWKEEVWKALKSFSIRKCPLRQCQQGILKEFEEDKNVRLSVYWSIRLSRFSRGKLRFILIISLVNRQVGEVVRILLHREIVYIVRVRVAWVREISGIKCDEMCFESVIRGWRSSAHLRKNFSSHLLHQIIVDHSCWFTT